MNTFVQAIFTLQLVRHSVKLPDGPDPGLSPLGIRLAQGIDMSGADVMFVSPMRRTRETLLYNSVPACRIRVVPLFREWQQGISTFTAEEDPNCKEPESEFHARVHNAWQYILNHVKPGQKAVVLSHEDFLFELQRVIYKDNYKMTWEGKTWTPAKVLASAESLTVVVSRGDVTHHK